MYPVTNALQNIRRQYKRYRILVPLILICSILTGVFFTIAVPCRLYSDQMNTILINYTDEEAILRYEQDDRARNLGESASLIQFGVMLIGAIAVLFVSSLMIGERMFDVGILYSVGLSRRQIFFSLFIELAVLGGGVLVIGLNLGRLVAIMYLRNQITQQFLPEEIMQYMNSGISELLCIIVSLFILMLPIMRLAVKLLKTDPNGFLRERK